MPRSRLPKSQVEISALKYYKKKLATEEKKLGRGITYDEDLAARGRELFGAKFNGVYPADVTRPFRGYSIVNLDGKNEPGSHWVAEANTLIYDSFGRNGILRGSGVDQYTDPDAEQKVQEDNCGQRCLAWLCVYHDMGEKAAKLV
jgi:hypothetical protein